MSNHPYSHDSEELPESNSSSRSSGLLPRRTSYANAASLPSGSAAPFLTHPRRTSVFAHLLNPTDETTSPHNWPSRSLDQDRDDGTSEAVGARHGTGPADPSSQGSLSRAFNFFYQSSTSSPDSTARNMDILIPNYLRLLPYGAKLAKQRDQLQEAVAAERSSPNSGRQNGSKRSKQLQLLPSIWNRLDKWSVGVEVLRDELQAQYMGPTSKNETETASIRTDRPIPPECGIYYYEVTVLTNRKEDSTIGVGLSSSAVPLSRPPGWEAESWGYHGDDGSSFNGASQGKEYGPRFTSGDTIGCGINFNTGVVFFTKNGVDLGPAFKEVKGSLFPTVGLKRSGEHIRANFGETPFIFDIISVVKKEKERLRAEIKATSTDALAPDTSETGLVQSLVLQFLQYDGYVETARAFVKEVLEEKKALSLSPTYAAEEISILDDQDANNRQQIRRAIMKGDLEKGISLTEQFYPRVLRDNEEVYFRLRCQRFIELVRRGAILGSAGERKKANGHLRMDASSHEMDVDSNGVDQSTPWQPMDTEDWSSPQDELAHIEAQTLMYGQQLQAEYQNDQRREVSKALREIWSLMAYPNPLKEPSVAHLLDVEKRNSVAADLNATILMAQGKPPHAGIERLYAQTSVLLEDLRVGGGPGAFVSLSDIDEMV